MQMHEGHHGSERDVVCNMTVTPTEATPRSTHGGTVYYFCSQGCKERFDRDPAKFVKA